MSYQTADYIDTKPQEELLWKNRSVSYRMWKAASLGAIVGGVSAAIAGYWYDYPILKPGDGYRAAAWSSIKLTGKVAFAFASASLAFQATNEIVNSYQERRTFLGPLLGGAAGISVLGLTSTYFQSSTRTCSGKRPIFVNRVFVCEFASHLLT